MRRAAWLWDSFYKENLGIIYDMAVPVKVNSNLFGMDYRVEEVDCQEERDPYLLCGGQAGQFPAPLDEGDGDDGHDGQVGALSGVFDYPVPICV